ncbi:MAG: hypothetical protein KY442_13880 [Proteobacteria bacterium]|nr:hypothetical protein [Pseudomonadota bacterium]
MTKKPQNPGKSPSKSASGKRAGAPARRPGTPPRSRAAAPKPAAPAAAAKPAEKSKKASKLPGWLPTWLGGPPRGQPKGLPAAPAAGSQPRDPYADREAARYEQPIASREMISQLLAAADGPMPAEALAGKLGLTAPDRFDALSARLRAMVRDGQLLLNRKGAYAPAAVMDLISGSVIANPDGFGFLRPEAGGDDLFLPPFEMRKALHGDRVLASVTGMDRRGRREGAIVEVLERRTTSLAEATPELRRTALQSVRQTRVQERLQEVSRELGVKVNPRFGRWNPETGQVEADESPNGVLSPDPGEGGVPEEGPGGQVPQGEAPAGEAPVEEPAASPAG